MLGVQWRPQPLPLLAGGWCAGLVLADLGWLARDPALLIGAALLGLASRSRVRRFAAPWLGTCVMLCAGAGAIDGGLARSLDRRLAASFEAVVEATVCGRRTTAWSVAVTLCGVTAVGAADAAPPRRVLLLEPVASPAAQELGALHSGQRIRAWLRLRPLEGLRNPGGRADARRLQRRGIGALASLTHPSLFVRVSGRDDPLRSASPLLRLSGRVDRWRARIAERLSAGGPGSALVRALAVGDRSGLAEDTRAAFAALGISHLLAVSGLHLALVTAALHQLGLQLLTRASRLAARSDLRAVSLLLAATGASLYALLCGFEIPVRRALVFVWVVVASLAIGRAVRPLQVVSLAALVVLLVEPAALFELGPQLSFAVTAAFLAMRATRPGAEGASWLSVSWRARLLLGVRESLAASAVAVAIAGPILALHGLGTGLDALWMNSLAIPWTAFVLLPSALIAAVATLHDSLPLADLAVHAAARIGGLTIEAVHTIAALRSVESIRAPVAPWVAGVAMVVAMGTLVSRRTRVRVALALAIGLWLRLAPPRGEGPPPPRVVMFDVGQGDALLVEGERAALLVDAGRAVPGRFDLGESTVLPALRALGVDRLEVVVASHADLDHRGGLPAILRAMPVDELWLPSGGRSDDGFAELLRVAGESAVVVVELSRESPRRVVGDMTVDVLWPPAHDGGGSRNDRSLVLQVEVAGRRLLLTGDLGADAERRLLESAAPVAVDILKVAHHGSASSTSDELLQAIAAEVALVSAPCGGRMGLPSVEALGRLDRAGAQIWWTGRDGAILGSLQPSERARRSDAGSGAPSGLEVHGWAEARSCQPPSNSLSPRQRARSFASPQSESSPSD
jgi:competence protein ComEC